MTDDRRRPLRDDELARIATAIDPRARATYCAPILGGLDAATYALDLDVAGERRELVVRIHTLENERDGDAARRVTAPRVRSNGMVLTHHDFWFGNTLWTGERLTGIVDWDEARIDDPAFDVAYARGDVHFMFGGDAAARLGKRYEARRDQLSDMPFWDLGGILPAFRWLSDWVSRYHEVDRSD